MTKTNVIDQFMWQWQQHFRISVEVLAETALDRIGARLDPQVMLIGLARDAAARHPVCIEPETGPVRPEHLSGIEAGAAKLYGENPDSRTWPSDAGVHQLRHGLLRRAMVGEAIAKAIESSGSLPGKRLFVSGGGLVAGFDVHVGVAVDRGRYEALPKLQDESVSGWPAPSSFTRGLIELVLREADAGLHVPAPNSSDVRRSWQDLVREAAERFCAGCLYRTGNFDLGSAFNALNGTTARAYEGAAASGRVLLVAPDHEGLEVRARFAEPVGLQGARAIRKLLQTTGPTLALLVHDGGAYGLGEIRTGNVSEDVFEVAITAHATWELRHREGTMLRVAYGEAALPRPMFDERLVADTLDRILGPSAQVDRLMVLISAASTAAHGTTLVISAQAATEAERLAGPATMLEPQDLSAELLRRYADMDGAVLIDPSGICHAVGVILDGEAHGRGDPSRGARYNSALRYEASAVASTVVVVVSEDGGVNLVPVARPRVRRQAVDDALTRLEAALEPDDPREFSGSFDAVKALSFYLSEEQCERANGINRAEQERRKGAGVMVIIREEFQPQADMNDSYFSD